MMDAPPPPPAATPGVHPSPPRKQKPGLFAWLACGCCILLFGVAVVIAIGSAVAVMAVTSFAHSKAEDLVSLEVRRQRALEILRPDELPEGYRPIGGLRVPFLFDIAALADEQDGLFLYLNAASFFNRGESTSPEDWLDGAGLAERLGVSVELGQPLGEGLIEVGRMEVEFSSYRGSVEFRERRRSGLLSALRVRCLADERLRVGLWVAPGRGDDSIEGTPADEQALASFLGRFDLCAK